jgi:hypothetical protein
MGERPRPRLPRGPALVLCLAAVLGAAPPRPTQGTIRGVVRDRQGKPVAAARVLRLAGGQRIETRTDSDGRFTLTTSFAPLDLLFVERNSFRFHGQRCDGQEPLVITLTRRTEPITARMTTLPRVGSRQERRRLAVRLLRPVLDKLGAKASDNDRLRPLEMLARVDAGRLLVELERRPISDAWYDGYVRRAAVKSLLHDSRDEARTIADSIRDPGFRATCYLDLADAVPEPSRAERLALVNQALVHSRAVTANDHRILHLAGIARRLWELGDRERSRRLLREGQAVARELPTGSWAGYARGAFAEDLALIDRPAALALMKDLKDPFEFVRHHANLALKLAGSQPAEAERLLDLITKGKPQQVHSRDHYAARICARMAGADSKRARKLADSIRDDASRARALGAMAGALAKDRPTEARSLLDEAFAVLARQVAAGGGRFNGSSDAASVAGVILPAVEAIDPTLVPEFFWSALSLRICATVRKEDDTWGQEAGALGALALVLSRYDRSLAAALADESRRQPRPADHYRAPDLQAAVLIDPKQAVARAEKLPLTSNTQYVRAALIGLLLAEGKDLEKAILRTLGQWSVDDDDV